MYKHAKNALKKYLENLQLQEKDYKPVVILLVLYQNKRHYFPQ